MGAAAMMPPLMIMRRLGAEERRAATARGRPACPASSEPTSCAMPWVMAGLMVYLAM